MASAAQQFVAASFGGDLSASAWGRYIVGWDYASGVLHVMLQVDRQSPDGQQQGEQAAHAIANFLKLGDPPAILEQVDCVETTDGTGTHIAQDAVR